MKRIIFSVLIALTLALAGGGDALAKAGSTSRSSGASLGSRGSRTSDTPIQRTLTPPTAPARPAGPPPMPVAPPRPGGVDAAPLSPGMGGGGMGGGFGQPMAQPGFFQRNPFMGGLLGGLVGAGIGGMLFGHSPSLAAAGEVAPGASFLGLLLQLALVGGLVWLGVKMFRDRSGAAGPAVNPYLRVVSNQHVEPPMTMIVPPRVNKEFEPSAADQQAFGDILLGVQQAWSEGNLAALRRWATPEVQSFLSEDLSRNTSEGLINKVEDVSLVKGDITESWSENGFDYATAVLTFQCLDYMVRIDGGAVAGGSLTAPVQHTEAWTFIRSTSGGHWLLSAVQQV